MALRTSGTPRFPARGGVLLNLWVGLGLGIVFVMGTGGVASADAPPADQATPEALVKALYDVISGPAGQERDWAKFRRLCHPQARLVPCVRVAGESRIATRILSVDDYVNLATRATKDAGFFEREVARRTERFGAITHVFSTYESRRNADDSQPFARGINSFQLVFDGLRWTVLSIVWDAENPDNPIPAKYLASPTVSLDKPAAAATATATATVKAADRPLEIFFIDVMGGAATLLVTPEGESVLLDSGWPGNDDRDPKRIIHVLTEVAKRPHLDHLVTTHWHTDHYGGVAGLARLIPIHNYWDRGLPEPGATDSPKADDPLMSAYLKASAGKRKALASGDPLPLKGSIVAEVRSSSGFTLNDPPQKKTGATAGAGAVVVKPVGPKNPLCEDAPADQEHDPSDNARSLTLRFRLGAFDFLDCGDLTWNVERKLVCPSDTLGVMDLFQTTHHGMHISNHPTLLSTIAPTVAVTNNGPRKGGHPETYKRLKALPSIRAIYQLHKNQATGPEDNAPPARIANPDPAGGRFIRVTVAPDGKTFTVRIGADGPAETFPVR